MALGTEVPADLRGLEFPAMVDVAIKGWQINNIYSVGISQLTPYPYAIAALQAAGMDEDALWATELSSVLPEPFEEVLDPEKIRPQYPNGFRGKAGFSYVYALEHGSPSDKGGTRSQIMLLEDGVPLTGHAAHMKIIEEGGGIFSHWGARGLIFSSSDNTDPRTNGREYRVVYPWQERRRGNRQSGQRLRRQTAHNVTRAPSPVCRFGCRMTGSAAKTERSENVRGIIYANG